MSKNAWIILGVVAGVGLLSCACCGIGGFFFAIPKIREAADRTKRLNELKIVGLAIASFQDANKRGPANLDELGPQLRLFSPEVEQRIRKGEIVVVWNAGGFIEQPQGGSQVLIAWESKPEPNGSRLVVYMDSHAEILTEQEFQQKPKAALRTKK